jgi:hypothetical protein
VDDRAEVEDGLGQRGGRRGLAFEDLDFVLGGGVEELFAVGADDGGDGAMSGGVAEDVFDEAGRGLAGADQGARRGARAEGAQEGAGRLGGGRRIGRHAYFRELDALHAGEGRAGEEALRRAGGGDPRAELEVEGAFELGGEGRLGGRAHDEAAGADAEQRAEHGRAALEGALWRGAGGAGGVAFAELDFVEEEGVPDGDEGVGALLSAEVEEGARGDALEAAAGLASRGDALGDALLATEDFAHALDDGRGALLLAEVAVRVGAELAHALEQVFLPREEEHGDVAKDDVALEGTAEAEAVEVGHEHVADDQVGRVAVGEVEGAGSVARLVDDGARRAEDTGEEPGDGRIVIGDDDGLALEADVAPDARLAAALGTALPRGSSVVEPGGHGQRALGATGREAHAAGGADGDEVADARDGAPDGREDFVALAEVEAVSLAGGHGGVAEAAAELVGEASAELVEVELAEGQRGWLAPRAAKRGGGAGAAELVGRGRLGEGAGRAEGGVGGRVISLVPAAEGDQRDELGERVTQQRLAELAGAGAVDVDDDDVGGERTGEVDGGGVVGGALDLEAAVRGVALGLGERVGDGRVGRRRGR